MEISHLGHACLLVETDNARILIDPGTMSRFADLRKIDAVLVTHQHPDHLDSTRVGDLLTANPGARLVIDADTAAAVAGLPAGFTVARTGDRLDFGATQVEVLGGVHAPVYGAVPGCANLAYLFDDGALLHPGDSFLAPAQDIDVLAVAIDGPWLKLAEAVDYVHLIGPRVAVPIHEGETTDPAKYAGMLTAFSPAGVVCRLPIGTASTL